MSRSELVPTPSFNVPVSDHSCCGHIEVCAHSQDEWAAVGIDMRKLNRRVLNTDSLGGGFAECEYCEDPDCLTIWLAPDGRPASIYCGPFQLDEDHEIVHLDEGRA